jgi:signal-transduction protein with cAMP-binding, CBS, and nucleotidyltransferase domain
MTRSNIRHLIVVSKEKKFLATLQEAELLCYLPAEHFLAPKPIHAIMTTNLITLHQDQSLRSALDLMSSLEISCVIVTDQSAPVGILSERDAIRLINDHTDLTQTLKQHMSAPIVTIGHQATVMDAQQVMSEHNIRHLVVVDKHKQACGVLTQHDLITPTPDLLTRALRRVISSRSREMAHRLALENVFESIQDAGTLVVNADGVIQFISPIVKHWCLLTDSAIGNHIDTLPNCELLSLLSRHDEINQGRLQEEIRHTLWDGRELNFEASLLPIVGAPGSFFLLLRDITARARSHNQLAAEFRLFE